MSFVGRDMPNGRRGSQSQTGHSTRPARERPFVTRWTRPSAVDPVANMATSKRPDWAAG